MTDHRRLQRALFRMQHDEAFAKRLRSGDAAAAASTGLGAGDLGLLLGAPAAGIEADAGGRRRAQFLRNVSSEHALTLARARSHDPELLDSFTASEDFHRAIREDLRLPPAFADHALRRALDAGDALLAALARLERAMIVARRGAFRRDVPPAGGLVLSERAEVLELPAGTFEAAAALRRALDADAMLPSVTVSVDGVEHALVIAGPRPSPHRLGEAGVELLSSLAGALLSLARRPVGAAALASFRLAHDVSAAELRSFVADLQAEGLVLPG